MRSDYHADNIDDSDYFDVELVQNMINKMNPGKSRRVRQYFH